MNNINYKQKCQEQLDDIIKEINEIISIMKGEQ